MSLEKIEMTGKQAEMIKVIMNSLTGIQILFQQDSFDFCAIVAVTLGEQLACRDDICNPEFIQKGYEPNAYRHVFEMNFKIAYDEHKMEHARIRAGMDAGNAMLKDVCEAFRESKTK
ncbi:MAG TPA: hypothetical protein VIY48_13565 [Candidatus Paceibacterota bacterium]